MSSSLIIKTFESVGLYSPLARAVVFGVFGFILENQMKFGYAYKDGNPRPWVFLNSGHSDSTFLPPGSLAILLAIFGGIFI